MKTFSERITELGESSPWDSSPSAVQRPFTLYPLSFISKGESPWQNANYFSMEGSDALQRSKGMPCCCGLSLFFVRERNGLFLVLPGRGRRSVRHGEKKMWRAEREGGKGWAEISTFLRPAQAGRCIRKTGGDRSPTREGGRAFRGKNLMEYQRKGRERRRRREKWCCTSSLHRT